MLTRAVSKLLIVALAFVCARAQSVFSNKQFGLFSATASSSCKYEFNPTGVPTYRSNPSGKEIFVDFDAMDPCRIEAPEVVTAPDTGAIQAFIRQWRSSFRISKVTTLQYKSARLRGTVSIATDGTQTALVLELSKAAQRFRVTYSEFTGDELEIPPTQLLSESNVGVSGAWVMFLVASNTSSRDDLVVRLDIPVKSSYSFYMPAFSSPSSTDLQPKYSGLTGFSGETVSWANDGFESVLLTGSLADKLTVRRSRSRESDEYAAALIRRGYDIAFSRATYFFLYEDVQSTSGWRATFQIVRTYSNVGSKRFNIIVRFFKFEAPAGFKGLVYSFKGAPSSASYRLPPDVLSNSNVGLPGTYVFVYSKDSFDDSVDVVQSNPVGYHVCTSRQYRKSTYVPRSFFFRGVEMTVYTLSLKEQHTNTDYSIRFGLDDTGPLWEYCDVEDKSVLANMSAEIQAAGEVGFQATHAIVRFGEKPGLDIAFVQGLGGRLAFVSNYLLGSRKLPSPTAKLTVVTRCGKETLEYDVEGSNVGLAGRNIITLTVEGKNYISRRPSDSTVSSTRICNDVLKVAEPLRSPPDIPGFASFEPRSVSWSRDGLQGILLNGDNISNFVTVNRSTSTESIPYADELARNDIDIDFSRRVHIFSFSNISNGVWQGSFQVVRAYSGDGGYTIVLHFQEFKYLSTPYNGLTYKIDGPKSKAVFRIPVDPMASSNIGLPGTYAFTFDVNSSNEPVIREK